jgi:hypothetical protein
MDLKNVDPVRLRIIPLLEKEKASKVRVQSFLKVLVLGDNEGPFGPEIVLTSAWRSRDQKLALYFPPGPVPLMDYLLSREVAVYDVNMAWDFFSYSARSGLVPLPAKTTPEEVRWACDKAREGLPHEAPGTVAACVVMLLTGRSPDLVTEMDGWVRTRGENE